MNRIMPAVRTVAIVTAQTNVWSVNISVLNFILIKLIVISNLNLLFPELNSNVGFFKRFNCTNELVNVCYLDSD